MKRIGIHDIARLANVSIGTVDRAMHGRKGINKETQKRILQIAHDHGYRPNPAARVLAVGRMALRIGVCIPREIHYFFDQLRDGILTEARRFESVGVSIDYNPTPRLGAGETERIRDMLDAGIGALIVSPGDPAALTPLIDEAEQKGIRTVCLNTDAPDSRRSCVVCVDPDLSGKCAAELMAKFLPSGSRAAITTGMLQAEHHCRKVRAFVEAFPKFCPGGEVIEVIEDHEDEQAAFEKCLALLQKVEKPDGLYVSTANCLPICAALEATGLAGKVRLITSDLFPQMVPFFVNGTIFASIHQRPYRQGQTAIRLIVDHALYRNPFSPSHLLNPNVALMSNLHLFRELRAMSHRESPGTGTRDAGGDALQ